LHLSRRSAGAAAVSAYRPLGRWISAKLALRIYAQAMGRGGEVGRPTDQHIPPGLPGFEDAAVYPLGGRDLTAARRLAGSTRRHAVLYTCDFPGCSSHGQILRSNLSAIGIELDVREFSIPELFERLRKPGEPFDIGYSNWFFDYADPFSYINLQFGEDGFFFGLFEDPRWQRQMDAVARLSGNRRIRAYATDGLPGAAPDLWPGHGRALRAAGGRRW
jgi:hypothetical protein